MDVNESTVASFSESINFVSYERKMMNASPDVSMVVRNIVRVLIASDWAGVTNNAVEISIRHSPVAAFGGIK